MITRLLLQPILESLDQKIVLLTGPRQTGKTTLAKHLYPQFDYFNFDAIEHRQVLNEKTWDRKKPLVIFDELHKKNKWKQWLKGIYDVEGNRPRLLVTGSANLETYRKVGASLAGRYFSFHLHPLDLKEVKGIYPLDDAFRRLWECGGGFLSLSFGARKLFIIDGKKRIQISSCGKI